MGGSWFCLYLVGSIFSSGDKFDVDKEGRGVVECSSESKEFKDDGYIHTN